MTTSRFDELIKKRVIFSQQNEMTEQLLENTVELKIVGVIRPAQDAANATISTAVAYTAKLTDYVIEHTAVCSLQRKLQKKTP